MCFCYWKIVNRVLWIVSKFLWMTPVNEFLCRITSFLRNISGKWKHLRGDSPALYQFNFSKLPQYQPWWLLAETQNIVLIFLHLFCNLSTFFSSAKKREKNGWEWSVIISLQWSLTFSEMLCPQLSGYPSITPWEQCLDSQSMKLTLLLSRQVKDFQQSGGHNFKIFIGDLGRGRGWGFRELLNTYYFPARSRIFNGNSE